MKRLKLAAGAILMASLAGCSHLEKSEPTDLACAGIDWWEVGRTDGVSGHAVYKLDDYKRRCNTGEHPVDIDLYLNGRDAGLTDFCTPSQGFAAGHAGRNYENVCPLNLEPAFKRAYDTGVRLSQLESQDVDLEARIANLTRLLSENQAGPAVRAQLDQLRGRRAELISEISKLETSSSNGSSSLQ
jgi:hypothetical protein